MLSFVNIENDVPYQDRNGIPDRQFGAEFAPNDKPLDFQYESSEAVTSFKAIKLDSLNKIIEERSLSTSLISLVDGNHKCSGLIAYSTPLDCGVYYYFVNEKYKSESFNVLEFSGAIIVNRPIAIKGLAFYDSENDIDYQNKMGAPNILFGARLSEMQKPLDFDYLSNEAISTFVAQRLNNLNQVVETINLDISLITLSNGHHICTGLENYATALDCGVYRFVVNDRYNSDIFRTISLEDDQLEGALLKEVAGYLLLETGGRLLLE